MSDTPQTDRFEKTYFDCPTSHVDDVFEFARQLERENAKLKAKNKVFLNALYDCIKYANNCETGNIEPRALRAMRDARRIMCDARAAIDAARKEKP